MDIITQLLGNKVNHKMSSETVKAKLYVLRHGECSGNVAQMALEPFSDKLTDVGKAQAELLGKCLKSVSFTRAFASDYPRTYETAQIILRQSEKAKEDILKPEKMIRERDYTGIVGQTAGAAIGIMTNLMKQGIPYLKVEMPESETVQKFEDRIIDFLSELIKDLRRSNLSEESILMVSHGLTIQRLMILLNRRAKDFGIHNWTQNLYSEKLMRNTTFHELLLEIPKDEQAHVTARVEKAHFREHVNQGAEEVTRIGRDVKDEKNYSFLDDRQSDLATFEEETVHYCKPV